MAQTPAATLLRAATGLVRHWSLTTLKDKLVKPPSPFVAGYGGPRNRDRGEGRSDAVYRHGTAHYIVFQVAVVAVPLGLFGATLNRIQTLSTAPT